MGEPGVVGEEWCISFLAKRTEQAFLQGFQILVLTLEIYFNRFSLLRYSKTFVTLSLSAVSDCDPMDCSLPGSSVHGILQARILEWVAIPFSRDWTHYSCIAGRFFTLWASESSAKFSAVNRTPASKAVRHHLFRSNNRFNGIPQREHYSPREFLLLFHYWIYFQVLSFNHLHCARTVVYSWLLKEEKPQIFKKSLFSF